MVAKCDDKQGGKCTPTNKTAGTFCDDGDACTAGDVCNAGACAARRRAAMTTTPATDNRDMATGCTQVANDGAPCDDANPSPGRSQPAAPAGGRSRCVLE